MSSSWLAAYCETCHLDFYPAGVPEDAREARHQGYGPLDGRNGLDYTPFWLTECGHIYCDQHLTRDKKGAPTQSDRVGRAGCASCRQAEIGVIRMTLQLPLSVASFFCDATEQSERLFHALQFQQTRLADLVKYLKERVVALEAQLTEKNIQVHDSIRTHEAVADFALMPVGRGITDRSAPGQILHRQSVTRETPRQLQPAQNRAHRLDVSLLTPTALARSSEPSGPPVPLTLQALAQSRPVPCARDRWQQESPVTDAASLKHRYAFRGDSAQPLVHSDGLSGTAAKTTSDRLGRMYSPPSLARARSRRASTVTSLSRPGTASGFRPRRQGSLGIRANSLSREASRLPPSTRPAPSRPPTRSTFRPASRLA